MVLLEPVGSSYRTATHHHQDITAIGYLLKGRGRSCEKEVEGSWFLLIG